MKTYNYIHLDEAHVGAIVEKMQQLLSSYQIHYTNIRGFHWNITGQQFFRLHEKFEELYNNTSDKIDDIAERILTLSGMPQNSFSFYLANSAIKDVSGVSCADESVKIVLDSISTLLEKQREILALATKAGDDSTAAMMGDYIREQEKLVWMLVAYFSDSCSVK